MKNATTTTRHPSPKESATGAPAPTDMHNTRPDAPVQVAAPKRSGWVEMTHVPYPVRNNELTLQEYSIF